MVELWKAILNFESLDPASKQLPEIDRIACVDPSSVSSGKGKVTTFDAPRRPDPMDLRTRILLKLAGGAPDPAHRGQHPYIDGKG